jgi:NADH-quinone oxidoreductase subunit L
MTHAFFKALLFLGAGIVIHALTGEQDMRKMGGLGRLLPWTYRAMLIGALALAGMPPLAGFFAKDSILGATIAREDWWGALLFTAGVLGAVLTGLYAFRMIFIVFTGAPSAFAREHLHRPAHGEAPFSMGSTVAVLAVLSIVGGWIQIPGLWQLVTDWLEPVAFGREQLNLVEASSLEDWLASLAAVLAALVGITVAWLMYGSRRVAVPRVAPLQHALEHKFYFDEAYAFVFYRPADALGRFINRWIEGPVFGGSITGLAAGFRDLGRGLSEVQTGFLRTYALAIAGGAAVLALVFVSVR